ncbi:YybH family protein [Bacteroidota bacterium]
MTEQKKIAIAEEVEARVVDYLDAIKQLDLARMLDFWADTEGFVFAGDGSLVVGYENYAAQLKDVIPKTTKVNNIEKKKPHIYVLAKDAVSYTMEYSWSMIRESGDTINAKGSWLYVFKKFDDKWQVVHSAGAHIYN